MDYESGQHKGFGFVEFREVDDATEAIFNLDGAELLGKTIRVSLAQANQVRKLNEAIWKSDEWFQSNTTTTNNGESMVDSVQQQDGQTLQET